MNRKRSLVVGASGFIGHNLWQELSVNLRYGTFCSYPVPGLAHLDIRDPDEISLVVRHICPSIIFHPAALSYADSCEERPDECWAINVQGTANLIQSARDVKAKFVYFSSDYVFDGQNGPYTEEDEPYPLNLYGKAKLAAERLIQEQLEDYLIIRTTGVYGWERRGKNFVMALIDRLRRGQSMRIPTDQVGSPTYAYNLVNVVLELVGLDQHGIFHVAGKDSMDRYRFACIAAEIFNVDKELLIPVSTPEMKQRAVRPLNAGLRIEKVQSVVSSQLIGPREGLSLMKERGNPFVS